VLEPQLFTIFINVLDEGIESHISKITEHNKLGSLEEVTEIGRVEDREGFDK